MKKVFLSLMAAAAALLVSSCAKEVAPEAEGNEAAVTFGLNLSKGPSTKAETTFGNGKTVNKLVYAIFNEDGELITTTVGSTDGQVVRDNITYPYKETVNLAKGQGYTIVFWAQSNATNAYTVSNDMKVTVNYNGLNNDENRDAFYKAYVIDEVTSSTALDVLLERPFAQLNVGVTQTDWDNAVASGINVQNSSVKLSGVATSLDLLTNTVDAASETEIKYALNTIPRGIDEEPAQELLNVKINGENKDYVWLSMSYVLPLHRSNSNILENLEFTFDPAEGNDYVLNEGLNNVPIQANYRTNIVGQILTGTIDFNISIDPIFDGEHNYEIGEGTESYGVRAGEKYYKTLGEALAAGESNIELAAGDYELNTHSAAIAAENVTITGVDRDNVKVKISGQVRAKDGVTSLTLKNLTTDVPKGLAYNEFDNAWIHYLKSFTMENCKSNGRIRLNVHEALIDNCEFNVDVKSGFDGYAIQYQGATNSTVTVSNSTFKTVGKAIVLYNESAQVLNLEVENCTFESSDPNTDKAAVQMHTEYGISGTVKIANSTATGFLNVNNGLWNELNNQTGVKTDRFDVTVTLADGVELVDGVRYVLSNAEGMRWFADEVNVNKNTFSGKTVVLANDIDLKNVAWTPVGQTGATQFLGTFDGQNHTISNLLIDSNSQTGGTYSSGLFGWIERHGSDPGYLMAVKNLKVESATVKGHHNVAVIAGYLIGTIENCHVSKAAVECTHANDDACGDKAGVIAGIAAEANALIKDCSASESTVTAGRDAGQIVGTCIVGKVENCTATNVTVSATGDCTGKNIYNDLIGRTN